MLLEYVCPMDNLDDFKMKMNINKYATKNSVNTIEIASVLREK